MAWAAAVSEHAALRLTVRAGTPERERARSRIMAHLQAHGTRAGTREHYAIELVLEEWLTNVFRHGAASCLEAVVAVSDTEVRLRFDDDGRPFDPASRPDPVPPLTLDDLEPGGLGLFLIRRYARTWRHTREGDRNILELCIDRADAGKPHD